jgi:hypothetical protein
MKIHPVGAELFHADGRTDRHDKANSRFSMFLKAPKNLKKLREKIRDKIKQDCQVLLWGLSPKIRDELSS